MDMDCKTTTDLVARILSGNGSSQDEAQLRSHVASCVPCTDVERRLTRTWALMGQLQPVTSKSPVPAILRTPRISLLRRPLWVAGAAAAALLLVSALAFSAFKSDPKRAPVTPVAIQQTPEESRPDQREEEKRVEGVLTKIEIENPASSTPVVAPKSPEVTEPKTVVQNPTLEPKSVEPTPVPKDATVKTPVPLTRPEEKTPVVPPVPVVAVLPVIATLDRVEGDVFVISAGKRSPVQSGAKLVSGDSVETVGKAGQAVVEFADGTRLVLGTDTIVDSIRLAEGKRVFLKQGVIAAQVAKQPAGEQMVFMTATAEARVLGTRLTLSVTPSSTRLEVREGRVRVTRKDDSASVEVTADHFVQVGKGISMAPKPVTTVRIAMHETFNRPRWGSAWQQGGEANLGMRLASENGSLSLKTLQKPAQDMAAGKMPNDAAEVARKAAQGAAALANLTKKEWPRMLWLETRQGFPFSNEAPLKIRTRTWNSHDDSDRITWFAINRGVSSQGLSLERRGRSLQLWVEGATAPAWKKDVASAQEWETLELWISKDQMVVRRNDETLYTGVNPLKVKAGSLFLGVNAKMELSQDEEVRFDGFDVILTTRAELEEVSR